MIRSRINVTPPKIYNPGTPMQVTLKGRLENLRKYIHLHLKTSSYPCHDARRIVSIYQDCNVNKSERVAFQHRKFSRGRDFYRMHSDEISLASLQTEKSIILFSSKIEQNMALFISFSFSANPKPRWLKRCMRLGSWRFFRNHIFR